ncbi:kinetochore scaffold 1 [Heptranchias perlo]|uniref:kinetochore scaffold 1 n=1 Tax=Heptranchias perlo TaxID=212740 RepID=UPI003559BE2F
MEPVGKPRRSSRRVSFAETKEVKEFVTDKMMMTMQDVENVKDSQKENQQLELERNMMPLKANFSIAGMDALLHAPLRTPLQQFESCEHIETVSEHQVFPISGLEVQRGGLEEMVNSSESKSSRLQKKIDFKSFLAGLDSTQPAYTNTCLDAGEEGADQSFSSIGQNKVPKQQKIIDFKLFLNSIKQNETDDQVFKQTGFGVASGCGAGKDIEMTNNLELQRNSINNLDSNRTVMFLDQDNDVEFPRSHAITINSFSQGTVITRHSLTEPKKVERLGSEGSIHCSFLQDKTVVFSGEECMDMTKSHTLPIDVRKIDHITNQNQLSTVTIHKNDHSMLPSFTPDKHKMLSDDGYCNKVNHNEALGATKLTSRSVSILSCFPSDKAMVFSETNDMDSSKSHTVAIECGSLGPVAHHTMRSNKMASRQSTAGSNLSWFPSDKTMVFSEANDMDITKSHTVAIDRGSLGLVEMGFSTSFPNNKTTVFSEANDMDITKSHTVAIESGSLGPVVNHTMGSNKMAPRENTVVSILSSFPSDKTMVFSETNDMDITKSHTVAIESGSLGQVTNEALSSKKMAPRKSTAVSILQSFPSDKSMVFSEANDMDITKSHTIAIENGSLGPVLNRTVGSSTSFPNDKTMLFSEANDMDITKSHTVAIDSGSLGQVTNEALSSKKMAPRKSTAVSILQSFPSDKSMVFSEANDMDITKSHTIAIENGSLGPVLNRTVGSSTSFPNNKSMLFSEANDMDITKSHTVAIDSGSLGQVTNEALSSKKMAPRKSTAVSILQSFPSDKSMVFSEANDMDITKSHTIAIENGSLGPVLNRTVGSSTSFPNDKTMLFSEANDMDITKNHTVAIDSGSLGQVTNEALSSKKMAPRKSTAVSILQSFPSDKSMVFSEANDMDITKSHTIAIENGSLGPVLNRTVGSSTSFPNNKTMMFSEANDMDITKSHTVAIDSGSLGQVTNEALSSKKMAPRKSTAVSILQSFPSDKSMVFSEANDMDITKSHTIAIENGSLGQVVNRTVVSSTSFPNNKTMLFSEANDMDITKSHTIAIENGSLEQVVNRTVGSKKMAPRESTVVSILQSFPSDKSMVFSEANDMDITRSHTIAIENGSFGQVVNRTVGSSTSFPNDKTTVFSEANDMDITKSHIVAIDSGSLGQVTNEALSSKKMAPRESTAVSILSSFPSDKSMVFSEANDMDITKSHTVAIDSGSLGQVTNEALGSTRMASSQSTAMSILSSFPNDKTTVFSEANDMDITKSHSVAIDSGSLGPVANHTIGSNKMASRQSTAASNLPSFLSDKTMMFSETNDMNITKSHTVAIESGSLEPVVNWTVGSNTSFPNDKTMLFSEANDRDVSKSMTVAVDSGSLGPVANEALVSAKMTSRLNAHGSVLSSFLNDKTPVYMSPLQKLNSLVNVTYDTALERPQIGDNDPADCQTWNAKTWFSKQNSIVKDTFKPKISLGIFPPKLPSRENLYKAVNSNPQDVIKTSIEHLSTGSLLSTMNKSKELEEESNVFQPNVDPQKQPDIQIMSQATDGDQIESKVFDQVELSHHLKCSEMHSLTILEQPGKEAASSASGQDDNVTGYQDQALGDLKMIKSVEQRLYQKRAWNEEEENGNPCSERKIRNLGHEGTDSSRQKVSNAAMQWEGLGHGIMEENLLSMTTKSLDSNNSLDSTKGDGTSAHAVTQKCNLNTSLVILEESELHEKLMNGQITVREFFKLLKIQTRAQKSRQSELQVNLELDKSSALENWLAVTFVHRPKRKVYEEDSNALTAAIAELKDQLLDLDKRLSEVNLPLWKEVVQMTQEELQQLRSCLNAKKTTFMKRTKLICHEQKVQLYSAQLNMLKAQRQQRKEYEDSLDDMLHRMDDCLASLDLANLDNLGECSADIIDSDESLTQLEQIMGDRQKELKKLQAEHCDLQSQLTKVLAEKAEQEKAADLWDLNEEFQELLEWELLLYQDEQAVYRFLFESLELTLKFGAPECAGLSPGEKCRRILDIKFDSELDEEEAPSHSKLVHELIMTYWNSRGCWQSVYPNESRLPMLLLDVSLVVSRCRLLGDELEYLLNWGARFDILKTDIQHTDVKYLFSSCDALSKFELTFHLKPGYPWFPLQFTFNSWFGNISGEHINEVLLTVKPGHKYLTRIVKSLFLTLLIIPGANRFCLQHASP